MLRDSLHVDSVKRAIADSLPSAMNHQDSLEKIIAAREKINKNDFPFFGGFPDISEKGKSLRDFIPEGWEILDTAYGDLNFDACPDYAVILQYKDSVRFIDNSDLNYSDTVLTQPRMSFILYKDDDGKNFSLIASNNSFIPNHDSERMEDPFQEMFIKDCKLEIHIQYFCNMGSYVVTNFSYKFRDSEDEFVLIGADKMEFSRNMGDMTEWSYNFMTSKLKKTTGGNMFDENIKPKVEWKHFDEVWMVFDKMKKPDTWQVTPEEEL